MKRRVKDNRVGNTGHEIHAGVDALERRRVVQRCQLGEGLDVCEDLIVDQGALVKLLSTVDNAMAHGVDHVQTAQILDQGVDNDLHGLEVVFHRLGDDLVVIAVPLLAKGVVAANLLAQALGDNALVVHVDNLVLKRRTTGIDNENVHTPSFVGVGPREKRRLPESCPPIVTQHTGNAAPPLPVSGVNLPANRRF